MSLKKLKFKYTWRNSQEKILRSLLQHQKDQRIHIVAAPGSGKTTLGIELAARVGKTCIVLVPNIAIREQWLNRIKDSFLEDNEDLNSFVSTNLFEPREMTIITYQSLDYFMKSESKEQAFVIKSFQKLKLGCLCLDEAHHLTNEWWQSLNFFLDSFNDCFKISLTATPPYDSDEKKWQRYIDLCGPIDEEIFAPELVREGSLCPHQDYLVISYPTQQELKKIYEIKENSKHILEQIDYSLLDIIICTHPCITMPEQNLDKMLHLDHYLLFFLIYLKSRSLPIPKEYYAFIDINSLGSINLNVMEILLQQWLIDDCNSFQDPTNYLKELKNQFNTAGCIKNKKIYLSQHPEISKLLSTSKEKLNSIIKIIRMEQKLLQEELRLLVLCDYIKQDHLHLIGDEKIEILDFGIVPIFEKIRREVSSTTLLGTLSGSIIIVNEVAMKRLIEICEENEVYFSSKQLNNTSYYLVEFHKKNNLSVPIITQLFEEGYIQILVGTKSLLGEGWDAPCINSLILASFVGSYMLSNQMRGRAIRCDKNKPDKVSNIWHLACISKFDDEEIQMMSRRFDAFLGLNYVATTIESGIGRIGINTENYQELNIDEHNHNSFELAMQRDTLRKRWQATMNQDKIGMQVIEIVELESHLKERQKLRRIDYILASCILGIMGFIYINTVQIINIVLLLTTLLLLMHRLNKILFPKYYYQHLAKAVLSTLKISNKLEQNSDVNERVELHQGKIQIYLESDSTRDKELFAKCVSEIFLPLNNPRYIIKKSFDTKSILVVPSEFASKKQDAMQFHLAVKKVWPLSKLIFTRNFNARVTLMKVRSQNLMSYEAKSKMAHQVRRIKSVKY